MPGSATWANALDHVIVVLFENRSLDNLLGRLYGPEDGKTFEGAIGKDLSNPIPAWAEHGADRKVVPYTVATDMDAPNPDSGEEWYHTNTQLYNVMDDHNRFQIGEGVTEPWNAPPPGATPTMDGFVTDYISMFTAEMGRQPSYDEYAQIMTGYSPEQVPVLSGSPLSPPEGQTGDALRAVRRVREGRRRGNPARLLADRAEHADRPRRLPPGARPVATRSSRWPGTTLTGSSWTRASARRGGWSRTSLPTRTALLRFWPSSATERSCGRSSWRRRPRLEVSSGSV